jgi:hypothetical protein
MFYNNHVLAKNDHLRTILWSIQIQMVMKTM